MPLFEFRCNECRKRFTVLVGVVADTKPMECTHCGSKNATKLISRFARVRSEDDRLDELADRMDAVGDDDPTAMREMAREMGKAMDDDMSDEMEQMFEDDLAGRGEDEP